MTFKKTFLSLLALITMGSSAMADVKPAITVADIEALPGETVSFYVNLSDGKDNTYKGITLYAYSTQEGFTLTDVTAATEWGATGAVGVINPALGNPSVSVNSAKALPSGTVDNLLTVSLAVDNSVALGEYNITLEKTALRYFDAYDNPCEDIADDITFKVKVVERITLDENSTIAPMERTGVNVKVIRKLTANKWSTICLPFELIQEKAKDEKIFGNDVEFKKFKSYEAIIDDVTKKPTSITLNFANHTKKLAAGTPYLIKTSKDITYFEVDEVDVNPGTHDVEVEIENDDEDLTGTFKGTLVKTRVPDKGLFISDNKFYYSNGKTNIKAFRGWFELDAVLNEAIAAGSNIVLSFDDENTGINTVHGSEIKADSYYDLQGRKIENPKKGLYIVNGKKTVIK